VILKFPKSVALILGDPGAVSGGGEKSKRARKKIREKKSLVLGLRGEVAPNAVNGRQFIVGFVPVFRSQK